MIKQANQFDPCASVFTWNNRSARSTCICLSPQQKLKQSELHLSSGSVTFQIFPRDNTETIDCMINSVPRPSFIPCAKVRLDPVAHLKQSSLQHEGLVAALYLILCQAPLHWALCCWCLGLKEALMNQLARTAHPIIRKSYTFSTNVNGPVV